jgi:hypothetical protein
VRPSFRCFSCLNWSKKVFISCISHSYRDFPIKSYELLNLPVMLRVKVILDISLLVLFDFFYKAVKFLDFSLNSLETLPGLNFFIRFV